MPRRKRLNKRVAFVGAGLFVMVTLLVIVALLRFGRNPKVFIADGDQAWAQGDYATAKRHYTKALAVKDKSLQIGLLFTSSKTGVWGHSPGTTPGDPRKVDQRLNDKRASAARRVDLPPSCPLRHGGQRR